MDYKTFQFLFKKLPALEQEFLKILAIAYEELKQTHMYKLLHQCGIKNKQKRVSSIQVKELKKALESQNWIVSSTYSATGMQSDPDTREYIMREVLKEENFEKYLNEIRIAFPYKSPFSFRPHSFTRCIRELRVDLYTEENFDSIFDDIQNYYWEEWVESDFFRSFFLPLDLEWFDQFGEKVKNMILPSLVINVIHTLEPAEELMTYLEKREGQEHSDDLYKIYLLQGDWSKLEQLPIHKEDEALLFLRNGIMALLKANYKDALKQMEVALRMTRKQMQQKNFYFLELEGLLHILLNLKSHGSTAQKKIIKYLKEVRPSPVLPAFLYLQLTMEYQNNNIKNPDLASIEPGNSIEYLFFGLTSYWNQSTIQQTSLKEMKKFQTLATQNGYTWMQMELAGILAHFSKKEEDQKKYQKEWTSLQKKLKVKSLLTLFPILEKWERSLQALLDFTASGTKGSASAATKKARIIYLLDLEQEYIQPKLQTLNKSGKWSAGRNIALKRMKKGDVKEMLPQDAKIAQAIKIYSAGGWGYYNRDEYAFDFDQAIKAMIGHPHLFLWNTPGVSIELVEKKPELLVEQKGEQYEMKFSQNFDEEGVQVVKETPTRYNVLLISKKLLEINRLLGNGTLRIPKKAKDQVMELVGNLSAVVTVQSTLGAKMKNVSKVKADATPYLHLLPMGEGFKLEFFVKPFKTDAPYFKPGVGRENVMAEIKGVRKQTQRKLDEEKSNAREVEKACLSLQNIPSFNGEWFFEETEDCLNVLLELEPLRKSKKIVLEYPKGEKIGVVGEVNFDDLSLQIKKDRDWFGIKGSLNVDGKKVMDFIQLLEKVDDTEMRFVELKEGKFLAITNQLRQQLKNINGLVNKTKKDLRFHPLAISSVEDFTDLVDDLQVDAEWKKQLKRLKAARAVKATVPSTFKAELRSYQATGFQWLSQLAHWGVGACLADDMGLGKTIQALALILSRAKKGAALVVAPASVARNWLRETQKFAPTLNPVLFGQGDRKKMIKDLKPFDLLISSYGLMQSEEELLAKHQFVTIVLDEAQAIKNRQTKRSKTAMKLQGDFKILTTGTPIENHLGEIWNLFNFLNPGLLGSLDHFHKNYALPIEKNGDEEKRKQLRRLLQPFILRRRKNDVLEELPAKTEITLNVELSEEERTFYEAIRQKAIANIAESETKGQQQRFQILAELMRLRQASCHPKLVVPKSKIKSSKLQLLAETVEELIENGHKALIFSQFVKHLTLVKEWVESKNIPYQYLDGQTPLRKREKAINAFQGGEGDLFLISLKAGGVGLNLTAADYVLHLDPWWNPAVEDQASDRAHRIGQLRPVTIYRFVAENTVEEKIVKLHAEKRSLADSLLEGTAASGTLSAAALLELIKGEGE